jgi:hypothetical protein
MQNAQIWKSIDALCNEAEAVIKGGTPTTAAIKSTAPPAIAREQKTGQTADAQDEKPVFAVLPSQAPPPAVTIVGKADPSANAGDVSLSNATMAEIAAAIDRAGKAPKTQIINQQPQIMSDQLRHDLMTEVGSAVRDVLANELPQMVRHAFSESLHELLTTTLPKGAAKSNSPRHQAIEAKSATRKAESKKTVAKKTVAKKTVAKKTVAKKTVAKKVASKKTTTKKGSRKTTSRT